MTSNVSSSPREPGFTELALRAELQRAIGDAGFFEPRPIQALAIPKILAGQDVLALAQTGTGKTAAFALPLIELLLSRPRRGPT